MKSNLGFKPSRQHPVVRNAIVGTAVCGVAVLVGSGVGIANTFEEPKPPIPTSDMKPSEVISALDNNSLEGSSFEDSSALSAIKNEEHIDLTEYGVGGIDETAIVELGAQDGIHYLAGTDSVLNICSLIYIAETGFLGSACNTPEKVEQTGLYFGAADHSGKEVIDVTTVLLPDSAVVDSQSVVESSGSANDHTSRQSEAWSAVSTNLAVADTNNIEAQRSYTFPRLSQADGDDIVLELELIDEELSEEEMKELIP
ncbi:MAG: hypothetical protein HLX51_01455 [Micrococcaceae bacterium]|nr:hypothetical protein [Micrococcaceae bacterium]